MPTLYVENVPGELYEALRTRAREHRKSISAEVLVLLAENVPTAKELAGRRGFLNRARRIRSRRALAPGPFPAAEQMQREDRGR
jgi:plasmid stability protein